MKYILELFKEMYSEFESYNIYTFCLKKDYNAPPTYKVALQALNGNKLYKVDL